MPFVAMSHKRAGRGGGSKTGAVQIYHFVDKGGRAGYTGFNISKALLESIRVPFFSKKFERNNKRPALEQTVAFRYHVGTGDRLGLVAVCPARSDDPEAWVQSIEKGFVGTRAPDVVRARDRMLRIYTTDVRSTISEADDGLLILLPEVIMVNGEEVEAYEVAASARDYFEKVSSGGGGTAGSTRRRQQPSV